MPYPSPSLYPAGTVYPGFGGEVAPTVISGPATDIAANGVNLGGSIDPNGLQTHYWFEYGLTAGYGITTPETNMGTVAAVLSYPIAGLTHRTTYHFRAVASNGAGTTYGADATFLTTGPILVRERPPLHEYVKIETPSGRLYRWGDDDPKPENCPSGVSYSDGQPGGFEQFGASLPRKNNVEYHDLEPYSNIQVRNVGGDITWEGRLERAPKVAGDEFHIDPDAVGWQAHLEDNKNCAQIFVDFALNNWESISLDYEQILADQYQVGGPELRSSPATGAATMFTGWAPGAPPDKWALGVYDAGPVANIDSIEYGWRRGTAVTGSRVEDTWDIVTSAASTFTAPDSTGNLLSTNETGQGTLITTGTNRYAKAEYYTINAGTVSTEGIYWRLAVYGDHGLTPYSVSGEIHHGFRASDIIEYVVDTYAPELEIGTVDSTSFTIPQLEYRTPTTPAEMIKAANRFHLFDWFIGPGKKFHYRQRGTYGRTWLARVGPARLEEQGLAADRCINKVLVVYQETNGKTRYVGPVGSSADAEDASLEDTDTENPTVAAGIDRWATLSMDVSTEAGAIQVGSRFLDEFKLVNHSGRAELVGWVMDDKGVTHPYSSVTAGDSIVFLDAADTSPRRIVKTSKSHSSRSVSVDLDAPPEGTQALLERLGAGLVNLGQVAAPAPPKRDPTKYYPASSFPGPDPIGLPI